MFALRFMKAFAGHAQRRRSLFTQAASLSPVQVQMPALSPTMEEGTIIKWLIKEGDAVEIGDAMCEVETDKAVVTMEASEEGTLAKILVPEGTTHVKISVPIAILAEEGEDIHEAAQMEISPTAAPQVSSAPSSSTEPTKVAEQPLRANQSRTQLSPAVRQALNHHGIEPTKVQGTGPKGLILKNDVLQYVAAHKIKPINFMSESKSTPPPVQPAASKLSPSTAKSTKPDSDSFSDLDLSGVRRVIAKRLTESKQGIPHAYSSIDCNINKLLKLRKELQNEGVKLSVNDFVIKAAAQTLRNVPEVNATWRDGAVELVPSIDVSVAVATDGGLITPIVKDAVNKGLSTIGDEIRELAGKARKGKLQPEEYQGGSFTISNLGMYGIREFTAIINPPQSCIMAVGGTRLSASRSAVDLDADDDVTNENNDLENTMTVTLSSDARVVDDHLASVFLHKFKRNLENPMMLGLL